MAMPAKAKRMRTLAFMLLLPFFLLSSDWEDEASIDFAFILGPS